MTPFCYLKKEHPYNIVRRSIECNNGADFRLVYKPSSSIFTMTLVMPQEIDVWYVIPAVRKELAIIFVKDYNLSQREAAKLLGITEASISHYINKKRAVELIFSKEELKNIKIKAKEIIEDKKTMKHMYELCNELRGSKSICNIHRKHEKGIEKDCNICMEYKS